MYDELKERCRACSQGCIYPSECCYFNKPPFRCMRQLLSEAADAIEELSKPRWIPVSERLPETGVHVLLSCKCGAGAYVWDGFHTEKYSTPTQFYEDIDADYNEDTDEYYFPEGWWEVIKNWDDYSCVAIEDKVTHWMPLPEPPKEEGE